MWPHLFQRQFVICRLGLAMINLLTVFEVSSLNYSGDILGGLKIFGRPYYRSSLWYSMSSVCLSSVVCPSVTFCIVAKRCVLVKKCLKEWIGNQGQKVHFLGRRHISTSGFGSTATETAVFGLFSTFKRQYLENGARYGQSYYWSLIGSHIWPFDW